MQTAGKILKASRKRLGLSLTDVARDTKINETHLFNIENDEYGKFKDEVFLTGYVKIYAKYLNLDVDKILAVYRRSIKILDQQRQTTPKDSALSTRERPWRRIASIAIAAILIVGILIYFAIQFNNFRQPPNLTISSPENDITVTEETIAVKGETDPDSIVTINDRETELSDSGEFNSEVKLDPGENVIVITTVRDGNSDRSASEIRNITYEAPEDEDPSTSSGTVSDEEAEDNEPFIKDIKIIISNEETWIQLSIDEEIKLSQVLPSPFDTSLEFRRSFNLKTGKAENTQIFVNNEKEEIELPAQEGVTEVTCSFSDNKLSCE